MNKVRRIKGWVLYSAIVAATLAAHACALEADEAAGARAAATVSRTM